jgi:hypothetical protein
LLGEGVKEGSELRAFSPGEETCQRSRRKVVAAPGFRGRGGTDATFLGYYSWRVGEIKGDVKPISRLRSGREKRGQRQKCVAPYPTTLIRLSINRANSKELFSL